MADGSAAPPAHAPVGATPPASTLTQLALAVIAGGGAANIYYNQPVLGLLASEFGPSASAFVATATLLGYGAGILFLVPLGDRYPRRSLIILLQILLAGALVVAALAPNLAVLTAASAAIGVFATSAQQAIPFAAEVAPEHARGRAVGQAMTGLFLGILLARTVSGTIAAHHGWRIVFAAAAGAALVLGALAATLPKTKPSTAMSYGALLASLGRLLREEPVLRQATLTQSCIFAAFNTFWASLALHLEKPPFELDPSGAGLFGLLGAAGALVAPIAGRIADRRGPRAVSIVGATTVLASFAVFAAFGGISLTGIGVGVLVLDVGVSAAMIANQSRIYALRPEARGRINTVYITGMFAAAALGASAGTRGFAAAGWPAVCGIGAVFAALAVIATLRGRRPVRR